MIEGFVRLEAELHCHLIFDGNVLEECRIEIGIAGKVIVHLRSVSSIARFISADCARSDRSAHHTCVEPLIEGAGCPLRWIAREVNASTITTPCDVCSVAGLQDDPTRSAAEIGGYAGYLSVI